MSNQRATFIRTVQRANPAITDQQGRQLYDTVTQGMDTSQLQESQLLKLAYQVAAEKPTTPVAPAAAGANQYRPGTVLPRGTPVEQLGTAMNLAQSQVSALDLGSADSRAEIQRIRDEYARGLQQNARASAGAVGMASGSRDAYDSNKEFWDKENAAFEARTLGALKDTQDRQTARAGQITSQAATLDAQRAAVAAAAKAEQELDQGAQKTESGAMDLKSKARSKEIGGPLAGLIRQSAVQQWRNSNNAAEPPKEVLDLFSQLTPDELVQFATPNFQAAWKATSEGRAAQAGADVDVAARNTMLPGAAPMGAQVAAMPQPAAPAQGAAVPQTPVADRQTQANVERERLRILKGEFDRETDPVNRAALQREMLGVAQGLERLVRAPGAPATARPTPTPTPTTVAAPATAGLQLGADAQARMRVSPIQVGRQTLSPLPQDVAGAQAEGKAAAEAEDRFRTYEVDFVPTIRAAREVLTRTGPGLGTETLARLGYSDSKELVNMFNRFNNIYPGVLPGAVGGETSKSIGAGGFTGSIVASLNKETVERMLDLIENTAARDRAYQQRVNAGRGSAVAPGQTGANTPVSSTTPPPAPKPNPATGVVRVSTEDEYKRLPSGTRYIAPDGAVRTKQ